MLKRMSVAEFLGAVFDHIEEKTGIPCYDDPVDKESPFYSTQLMKTEPADTKTSFVDRYEVWVHCISSPSAPYSNQPVLDLVTKLEEVMTEEISVCEPYRLNRQVYKGLQTLKKDESNEGHAILSFDFFICYGFKFK